MASATSLEPLSGEGQGTVGPAFLTGRAAITVVLGIFLSLLMGSLDSFVVLTALPNIVTELGQPSGVTFVISAYLIASTVAIPVFGKLSDLYSRRNVFVSGIALFIAGSAFAGLSQNLNELILFRAVQGFGSGCFFPVGLAIIAVAFPPERRAQVTGILSGIFGIATVAGPFLGDYIVSHTTWRWIFYINIPIGVLGVVTLVSALGALRPSRRGTFDTVGAGILSGWVGSLMFAVFQVSDAGWLWTDSRIIGLLIAAVVLFVLFILWEFREPAPLVPIRMFARRVVASSGGVAFLRGMVVFSMVTFVSVFVGIGLLHGAPGASATVRDVLYWMFIPLVIGAAIGGQLVTRIPYRPIVFAGMGLATVGVYLLTLVSSSTPVWTINWVPLGFGGTRLFTLPLLTGGIVLPLIPLGFGGGLTFAATTLSVQFQMPVEQAGAATSIVAFVQGLGSALGIALLATYQQARFSALSPSPISGCSPSSGYLPACIGYLQQLHTALVTSYTETFTLMLALILLSLLFSLGFIGRLPKSSAPAESATAVSGSVPSDGVSP